MMAAAPSSNGPLLRDIHLPPSPSWWPLAPGWWGLVALLVLALLAAAWWWRRRRRQLALERRVLAEVDQALARWRDQPQALAAGLHQLLRRAAVRIDAHALQQQGEAWRQTLARMPGEAAGLAPLHGLDTAMYRPDVPFDVEAAAQATRRWLQWAWRQQSAPSVAPSRAGGVA